MAWSEDRLHRWLARTIAPRDAAVLRSLRGRPVLCADACIEGVHFERGTPARRAGAKAAQRALSDLAASGARPIALLLTLSAPRSASETRLRGLIEGVRSAGTDLVGGDLACHAGPVHLSVAALGVYEFAGRAPGRDRARAGDVVLLTGPVGGSRLGRHLRFQARLAEGRFLARAGAHALMDVSDGLAWDLFRLARAAGVALELELAQRARPPRRAARRRRRARARAARRRGPRADRLHRAGGLAPLCRARAAALPAAARGRARAARRGPRAARRAGRDAPLEAG